MTTPHDPVVITGLGIVAGPYAGARPFAAALQSGAFTPTAVDRSRHYHRDSAATLAVLATGADLSPWVTPAAARRMSRPSRFAVAAARMALDDAGGVLAPGAGTAVVMATSFGAIDTTENILRATHLEGPDSVSPSAFTESVANAAAAQIAIAVGANGPSITVVRREAGALTALGRGADEVASGRAACALVGCVEEMPAVLHAFLDRFDALARAAGPLPEAARPFDGRRNGYLASEGAVVLLLEPESRARQRGAAIYARLRGYASAFDPSASQIGFGRGAAGLGRAIDGLLTRAGATAADVGCVVSGASGSIAGDRLEAHTLRAAWHGRPLPPLLTPKRLTGEYGGGFLAAAVLAVTGTAPAPPDTLEPDAELGVTPYGERTAPSTGLTLATSVASGGSASWILFEAAA